jgi:hypothetical protein
MTTSYTRDRGYTRARRMGRDEEEGAELREMLDDPDLDPADMLGAPARKGRQAPRDAVPPQSGGIPCGFRRKSPGIPG